MPKQARRRPHEPSKLDFFLPFQSNGFAAERAAWSQPELAVLTWEAVASFGLYHQITRATGLIASSLGLR
jgi:hypothetical protein